jgi:hypothetical protein
MSNATPDTRLAILEYQMKTNTDTMVAISGDLREMKDALLKNLASTSTIGDVKDDVLAVKSDVNKIKEFMWKVMGIVAAIQTVGIGSVVYMFMHMAPK